VIAELAATPPVPLLPPIETHVASTIQPLHAPVAPRPVPSPVMTSLQPMLRSPEGLRTAFLIREILGPPVARRGGRRVV
jgi:hypothetical protein